MKQIFTLLFFVSLSSISYAQVCPSGATFNGAGKSIFAFATEDEANYYEDENGNGELNDCSGAATDCNQMTTYTIVGINEGTSDALNGTGGALKDVNGAELRSDVASLQTTGAGDFAGTVTFNFMTAASITCTYAAGVLPVLYADLTANKKGKTALISWTTGSEINNDYFSIERSTNGKDFTAIGKVTGAGNSEDFVDYSFTDKIPFNGVNYYRLRQVDFDGAENLSEIQTVKMDNRQTSAIAVYPTLSEGEVIVDLTIVSGDALETQIVTSTGAIVRSLTLNGGTKATINTSDLASGFYFINVKTAQSISVGKFMVR